MHDISTPLSQYTTSSLATPSYVCWNYYTLRTPKRCPHLFGFWN